MDLMPINPKKVKVGRRYYVVDKSNCGYCEIVAILKGGYKVRDMSSYDEDDKDSLGKILPKLRKAEDLALRRPDYMVGRENPREK